MYLDKDDKFDPQLLEFNITISENKTEVIKDDGLIY